MITAASAQGAIDRLRQRGMTLIELLVVIAVIAGLAALLLPALSNAKANSKMAGCLNNLKQTEVAYQMYAADNSGKLMQNVRTAPPFNEDFSSTNSWVYGNMKSIQDSTNTHLLQAGELFPYLPQSGVFRCPADPSNGRGLPRVRSYSMNAWTGSPEMEMMEQQTPYRTFLKENDFAATAGSGIWVFIDEHILTLSDGWFVVTMDDSDPFERLPATRHLNSYCLNFADGHAETYHLRVPSNQIPETGSIGFSQAEPLHVSPTDPDWLKLRNATTSR